MGEKVLCCAQRAALGYWWPWGKEDLDLGSFVLHLLLLAPCLKAAAPQLSPGPCVEV